MPRSLALEVAGVLLLSLLLGGVRILLPEPAAETSSAIERAAQSEFANRHYDRGSDERDFYAPVIRQIYARWPAVDLRADSLTEKPPGYPFLMATAAKVVGLELNRLRAIHLCLSAMVPAVLYGWLRRYWTGVAALALVAPFMLSSFLVKASAYLVTDNPALLFVVLSLILLLRSQWSMPTLGMLVGCNAAAVVIRQNTLWLVGPTLIVAGLLARDAWQSRSTPEARTAFGRALVAAGAVVAPCVIIGWLFASWGGVVPSSYYLRKTTAGFGFAPLAYCLSVVAICWWPYLLAQHGWRAAVRTACRPVVLACGVAGLLIALASETSYDPAAGRWGGYLWTAVLALPAWGGRALVFILLAPLGSAALAVALRPLVTRDTLRAVILIAALLGWALTCAINPYIFHRYYEPYALLFAITVAVANRQSEPNAAALPHVSWLAIFGAGQFAITVTTLYLSLFASLRR